MDVYSSPTCVSGNEGYMHPVQNVYDHLGKESDLFPSGGINIHDHLIVQHYPIVYR